MGSPPDNDPWAAYRPGQQQAAPPAASVVDWSGYPAAPPRPVSGPEPEPPGRSYTSQYLPFWYDMQGKRHTDWSLGAPGFIGSVIAGLPEFAAKAISGPYDAVTGKIPIVGPEGGQSPMIDRAMDTGALMTGTSPAYAARAGTLRVQMPAVPTTRELHTSGSGGYDALRANQFDVSAQPLVDTGNRLRSELNQSGRNDINAPNTHLQLERNLPATAPPGAFNTLNDYLTAMDAFRHVSGTPTDVGAAATARQAVHDTLSTLQPGDVIASTLTPGEAVAQLGRASGDYGAAMRSNRITGVLDPANTGILERADLKSGATNSGKNFDNSLRLKLEAFMADPQNVAGLSAAEREAFNDAIRGSRTQNFLRSTSNLTGGGGGLGQALMGAAGASQGGFLGAAAAMLPGSILKGVENRLARGSIQNIDEMLRMRSPLYEERLAAAPQYRTTADILRDYLLQSGPPRLPRY